MTMMMVMKSTKREIISRETIKPSSPTPPHLASYELSLLDQIAPNMHVRFALFYPFLHHEDYSYDKAGFADDRLLRLKKSVSETLTHYYPFAGRLRDKISIDCNDAGVEFIVSRINCEMPEILEDPYSGKLNLFFSSDLLEKDLGLLLIIQVSFFECQGIAIGVSCSHVIADASTLSTFMSDWASKAHLQSGEEEGVISPPQFIASSIFPSNHLLTMPKLELECQK